MTYQQIAELINYGTDAQCRAKLEELLDLMRDYSITGVETAFDQSNQYEDAQS